MEYLLFIIFNLRLQRLMSRRWTQINTDLDGCFFATKTQRHEKLQFTIHQRLTTDYSHRWHRAELFAIYFLGFTICNSEVGGSFGLAPYFALNAGASQGKQDRFFLAGIEGFVIYNLRFTIVQLGCLPSVALRVNSAEGAKSSDNVRGQRP